MTVFAALGRGDFADYLAALVSVYSLIIIIYILTSMIFSFGVRMPYARWSQAALAFLRDVCEPYLRIFRRFIPMVGPLDLSPILALIVLQVVGGILVRLLRG